MIKDIYGQIILTEKDIFHHYMKGSGADISTAFVNFDINFSDDLEVSTIPKLIRFDKKIDLTIKDFDSMVQDQWMMPDAYYQIDIVSYLYEKCSSEIQINRVKQELSLYQERNLYSLLKYLIFLVETMRKYNIVWGVGRGSSVSSYVLYLIGIHKIDALKYNLDVTEFLK